MDYIPLSKGKGVALVDDEDYDRLCKYRWSNNGIGYVQTWINGKSVLMHRLLSGAKKGDEVDHINRVKQDNRKENLRIVSHRENMANCPVSVRGYTWHKEVQKWQAQIKVNRRTHYLGLFDTEADAAAAYKKAKKDLSISP